MTMTIRSSSQVAALLAAANQRGTALVHQRPATAARSTGPYLLPSDLAGALQHLSADELKRLFQAVTAETKRRTPAREMPRRGFPFLTAARRAEAGLKDVQPTINQGRANAIRAAIKAGVKPTVVSRQFGVSASAIRLVLANKS